MPLTVRFAMPLCPPLHPERKRNDLEVRPVTATLGPRKVTVRSEQIDMDHGIDQHAGSENANKERSKSADDHPPPATHARPHGALAQLATGEHQPW